MCKIQSDGVLWCTKLVYPIKNGGNWPFFHVKCAKGKNISHTASPLSNLLYMLSYLNSVCRLFWVVFLVMSEYIT